MVDSDGRAARGPHDGLSERLLEVIGRGACAVLEEDEFDDLALDVFAYQFARNPLYRAYCERHSAAPDTVKRWLDIPAVPTDAFKAAPLSCGDPAHAAAVFRTSGTTAGRSRRGTHFLLDTDLYRAALLQGFRAHLLPDRDSMRILSLIPSYEDAPDSSLSFMMTEVIAQFGADGSRYFISDGGLRVEELATSLRAAEHGKEEVMLVGTSLALLHLLDELRASDTAFRLPPGSRIMDTGGFKGRSREVGRDELYRALRDHLGVGSEFIVNEYGMTEMSSQLYDGAAGSAAGGAERRHRGPGWVRTAAVDPETLTPIGPGIPGILRHLDLANLYSVAVLQTADLGIVGEDGAVELHGRAPGAEPRGCSIAMDELLELLRP